MVVKLKSYLVWFRQLTLLRMLDICTASMLLGSLPMRHFHIQLIQNPAATRGDAGKFAQRISLAQWWALGV
jgi:hypothetical protein